MVAIDPSGNKTILRQGKRVNGFSCHHKRLFNLSHTLQLSCAALASACVIMPCGALAQARTITDILEEQARAEPPRNSSGRLPYTLKISPQITFSDNVDLSPDSNAQADGLASVVFEGGLLLDRVNFSGYVNGRIEVGSYFDPPVVNGADQYEQFVVDQDITAAGTANFIDNFLYLDAALSARKEALDERSAFSTQSLAANDQQADSFSYSISPYVFSKLVNESTVEARYRYTDVTISDDDAVDGVQNFLNDSRSHEVLAEYTSGKLLDRVGFSLRAYGNQTKESGSDVLPEVDYAQTSVSGDLRYPLSRKLSVVGTVGYDDINTNGSGFFDDDDLSGVFWKAGLLATPGRRTRAQLEVGTRFGGLLVEGNASYEYSSRLQFRADASRSFRTSGQAGAQGLSILQSETLGFAEELRQAQNVSSRDVLDRTLQFNNGLSDLTGRQSGLAKSNNANFSVIANTKKTDFVLSLGYDQSDFGFQKTETVTLGGQVERKLSRRLGLYGRGTYQLSNTDMTGSVADCVLALSIEPSTAGLSVAALTDLCQNPDQFGGDAQTLSLLGGINYQLYKDVSAYAQISRTERFADDTADEFDENAITLGLTFEF